MTKKGTIWHCSLRSAVKVPSYFHNMDVIQEAYGVLHRILVLWVVIPLLARMCALMFLYISDWLSLWWYNNSVSTTEVVLCRMKYENGHERREVEIMSVFIACLKLIYLHSLAKNEGNLSQDSLVTQPKFEQGTSYIQVYNFTSIATCSKYLCPWRQGYLRESKLRKEFYNLSEQIDCIKTILEVVQTLMKLSDNFVWVRHLICHGRSTVLEKRLLRSDKRLQNIL
jgi:hypothetical protein